jgi:hypothetical protein
MRHEDYQDGNARKERDHRRIFRSIVWKLDKRLIPFLFLLEFSSYINRISIGAFYSTL